MGVGAGQGAGAGPEGGGWDPVGRAVPAGWRLGDEWRVRPGARFAPEEVCAVLLPDGTARFGRVLGPSPGRVGSYEVLLARPSAAAGPVAASGGGALAQPEGVLAASLAKVSGPALGRLAAAAAAGGAPGDAVRTHVHLVGVVLPEGWQYGRDWALDAGSAFWPGEACVVVAAASERHRFGAVVGGGGGSAGYDVLVVDDDAAEGGGGRTVAAGLTAAELGKVSPPLLEQLAGFHSPPYTTSPAPPPPPPPRSAPPPPLQPPPTPCSDSDGGGNKSAAADQATDLEDSDPQAERSSLFSEPGNGCGEGTYEWQGMKGDHGHGAENGLYFDYSGRGEGSDSENGARGEGKNGPYGDHDERRGHTVVANCVGSGSGSGAADISVSERFRRALDEAMAEASMANGNVSDVWSQKKGERAAPPQESSAPSPPQAAAAGLAHAVGSIGGALAVREAKPPAAPEMALAAVLAENEALRAQLRENESLRAEREREIARLAGEVEQLRRAGGSAADMMPLVQHEAAMRELADRHRRMLAEIQACANGRAEELRQQAAQARVLHEATVAGLEHEAAALRVRLAEASDKDVVPRAVFDEHMQGMAVEIARLQRELKGGGCCSVGSGSDLSSLCRDALCGQIDEALALLGEVSPARTDETSVAVFCEEVQVLTEEVLPGALQALAEDGLRRSSGSRRVTGLTGDLERIEKLVDDVIGRAEQVADARQMALDFERVRDLVLRMRETVTVAEC
jgi:hypothetical protein